MARSPAPTSGTGPVSGVSGGPADLAVPAGDGDAVDRSADVIVVGAGPAGSTAATYLARAGLDVLLLEKSTFPRPKVCGDGFTPRGMKQLIDVGLDCSQANGWLHNRGLRVLGGGVSMELDWPDLAAFPDFGAVRPRQDFDELLVRHAEKSGARLRENTSVTEATTDERTGRVTGVKAVVRDVANGRAKREVTFRAPLTLACDGVSARVALSLGMAKRDDRPMGVAVRRYYTSPRTHDDYLESHLELWDRTDPSSPRLLPGYGWIFGMGDGTSNVGLGILSTSRSYGSTDYRALLKSWLDGTPEEWGYRDENAVGTVGGAALPMGFNRTPHYRPGLLLVGDSGGTVNPFNGEGIAYAMESASIAADCSIQGLARTGSAAEHALSNYPLAMREALGSYYRIANLFSQAIGNPKVMALATRHGLPRKTLMAFLLKLLANLYDPKGGDASDRLINAMTRLTPSLR